MNFLELKVIANKWPPSKTISKTLIIECSENMSTKLVEDMKKSSDDILVKDIFNSHCYPMRLSRDANGIQCVINNMSVDLKVKDVDRKQVVINGSIFNAFWKKQSKIKAVYDKALFKIKECGFSKSNIFFGSLFIQNICYDKKVKVIYSIDNWESYKEISAKYDSWYSESVEIWKFSEVIPNNKIVSSNNDEIISANVKMIGLEIGQEVNCICERQGVPYKGIVVGFRDFLEKKPVIRLTHKVNGVTETPLFLDVGSIHSSLYDPENYYYVWSLRSVFPISSDIKKEADTISFSISYEVNSNIDWTDIITIKKSIS